MSSRSSPYLRAAALPYESVGGWMLFLCIALCVIRPVMGGFSIYLEASKFSWAGADTFSRSIFVSALTMEFVLVVFGILAGAALWTLSKHGVGMVKSFLIAQFVLPLLFYFVLLGLIRLANGNASELNAVMLPALGRTLIFGLLWWLYLHRSERVKRTFELQREREAERLRPAEAAAD